MNDKNIALQGGLRRGQVYMNVANTVQNPSRWTLFIDDERDPVESGFFIARTSAMAIALVKANNSIPNEICFDHDLGNDDTTIVFVNWLIDQVLDGKLKFPKDFVYSIHSQNPIGAMNIKSKLDGFLSCLQLESLTKDV